MGWLYVTLVVSQGLYNAVLDALTQEAEILVRRNRSPQPTSLEEPEGPGPPSVEPPSCLPTALQEFSVLRSLRMGVLGCVQSIINLEILDGINRSLPEDLSWHTAILKGGVKVALAPPFTVMSIFLVETMRTCGLDTVWPKIKQEFVCACLISFCYFPVYVFGFRFLADPATQSVFFLSADVVSNMAVSHILNRDLPSPDAEPDGDGERPGPERPAPSPAAPPAKPGPAPPQVDEAIQCDPASPLLRGNP
eukprot:EG_transcript_23066